jgi:hypothetical protein
MRQHQESVHPFGAVVDSFLGFFPPELQDVLRLSGKQARAVALSKSILVANGLNLKANMR